MRHQDGRILWFDGAPLGRALSAGASIFITTSTTTMTTKTSRRAAGVM